MEELASQECTCALCNGDYQERISKCTTFDELAAVIRDAEKERDKTGAKNLPDAYDIEENEVEADKEIEQMQKELDRAFLIKIKAFRPVSPPTVRRFENVGKISIELRTQLLNRGFSIYDGEDGTVVGWMVYQ